MSCRIAHVGALTAVLVLGGFGHSNSRADPTTAPSLPAMPDTTPPGKPHFDSNGAQVGEQLPALPVYTLEGEPVTLDYAWTAHCTLLITASYTCPRSRNTYPKAAALAAALKNKASLAFIYVIEAHPSRDPSPYSGVEDVTNENRLDHVLCAQPRTLNDRLGLARQFQKRMGVTAYMYVDAMNNAAWKALGAGPNMGILVDENGFVLARQGWFDAASMKKAADVFLAAVPLGSWERNQTNDFHSFDDVQPTREGSLEKVKAQIAKSPELLTKVFPYEQRGHGGDRTLLHYAVDDEYSESQHIEIVRFLVERGADVNKQTDHVPSPLHLAAKNGNLPIAKFLIERGADVNAKAQGRGPTPLQEALINNRADIVELLVRSGAKSNFYTDIATGKVEAVRVVLNRDPSIANRPDGWGRPPLTYAAAGGQAEMVKLLLVAGAQDLPLNPYKIDVNPSAIWWAVHLKRVAMVRLLCENGSSPNLLDDAIYVNSVDVARELLANKADPNLENMRGDRPLHIAAILDRAEIALILMDSGADPNSPTGIDNGPCGSGRSDLDTPLHLAARAGSSKIVSLLIKRGVHPNPSNADGQTPLHLAAGSYQPPGQVLAVVKLLVEAKVDVNAKDTEGQTPLDYAAKADQAAEKRDPVVVKFLVEHGAKSGAEISTPNAVPPAAP